jgi:hypothetical protein
MTKASINLQDLRRRLYVKAKAETSWRFWGLYVHVCKLETLRAAYVLAQKNDGAPGVDGVTFAAIEAQGVEAFLVQIRDELVRRTYAPLRARRQEIPKDGGKVRVLSIPAIRDRVVQGALKLILEPIFEADFQPGSFGYTPKLKKRTALLRKLKDVFRRYQSQPVDRVVQVINPMLRGWVNYFAVGHSSACFSFIKDWVEKKVRRHMLRARKRKGFGWTRWSRPWLYETLKLFNSYRVRRSGPKVAPAG